MSISEFDFDTRTSPPLEWEVETKADAISTADLDAMIKEFKDKEAKYEAEKEVSNKAYEEYQASKEKVLAALEKIGKTKYHVDGLGTVSRITQYKVTTPKDLEQKKQMLMYLKQKGPEVYLSMVGVNYQTLNAFYNQEAEAAKEKGEVFQMPGVEAPTAEEHLRFTKERSKK